MAFLIRVLVNSMPARNDMVRRDVGQPAPDVIEADSVAVRKKAAAEDAASAERESCFLEWMPTQKIDKMIDILGITIYSESYYPYGGSAAFFAAEGAESKQVYFL